MGRVLELWGQQNGAQLAFDAGPSARAPLVVPPVVLTGLTATLRDRNLQVRLNATYAAGVIATTPDAALVSALIDSLTHPEREIRFAAARVLGRLAAGSAGDALIFAMNDPVDEVRYAAVEAIGEVRAERALQALEDQIAYYERGEIVILALQALARIGHPSSAPRFEGLVSDANPNVRRIAVEGMARASAPERVFELEARLATESDPAVRLAMAFALASRGRAYLDQLVDDMTRPETADLARRYMTELATSATQDLHPFLHNSNAGVRLAAADILGFVGTAADVAALEPLTRDPDTAVVSAGDLAVKRIRSRVP